jgi:hypothetical protein
VIEGYLALKGERHARTKGPAPVGYPQSLILNASGYRTLQSGCDDCKVCYGVIRDRVAAIASPAMSAMPPKTEIDSEHWRQRIGMAG